MSRKINRRDFLKTAAAGTAGIALSSCLAGPAGKLDSKEQKPNLIYVFADQLGTNHCGYAGSKKARTTNIDRLASQGISFGNAVSTMPVCAAHRATLFTGKYPTTTGMVINELRMNTKHRCIGHVLTESGYQTGYIGKWHLFANQLGNHHDPKNSFVPPGPNRLGFDGYWAAYNFNHDYYNAYHHTDSPKKIYYGKDVYEPDGQTDLAINFLKEKSKQKKPFALFLSYGVPHDPWNIANVPQKYYSIFKDESFPNPNNYKNENDKYSDSWGRISPEDRKKLELFRRIYYAMTACLDDNIARLLRAIEDAGISNNTIVVFSSDHGEMFGAHGRRNKNIFYDDAARVPFIIRWPGKIKAGSLSDACLGTVDIMPTILGLMNLPIPKESEGMDLSKVAVGLNGQEPQAALMQNTGACAVFEDGHEWRALRDKRFTYAKYRVDGFELLFDNISDPYQMNNLAKEDSHRETMDKFRNMLSDKMKLLNDNFEKCTWYRDNWTDGNRIILRGAKG